VIVDKLLQTSLIELERGKRIRYHRMEFRKNFVKTYGNSSAFAHQWRIQDHLPFMYTAFMAFIYALRLKPSFHPINKAWKG